MIGRNGVSENSEGARANNVFDLPDVHREIFEERRFMNVVALLVPLINVAGAGWNFVPLRILVGEIAIKFSENFRSKRGLHGVAHFLQARPEIAQKSVFSAFVLADRLFGQIEVDPARERESDYQRRRHQEIRLNVLMDTRFKVAVSGKDRCCDQIIIMNRFLDLGMKRAGITDAGGTTISDQIESQLIQIWLQSSFR